MPQQEMELAESRRRYWRSNLRMTGALLALWFAVTFGGTYYARELSFNFLGWPFGFWATAQGALLVFCAIVWVYALAMDRLDEEHGRPAGDDDRA